MEGGGLSEAGGNCGGEGRERVVGNGIKALFFDELPQAFDQVQVGRVAGQEKQLDAQGLGQSHDDRTSLITRVIEDKGDRYGKAFGGDLVKQITDAVCVDVGVVCDRDDFMGHGVERA